MHTHPDLAPANHLHTDLASKELVNGVLDHYIPGSKRQCVRYSPDNLLAFDGTQIPDPSYIPSAAAFEYRNLVHFNALNSYNLYLDEKARSYGYIGNNVGFITNGTLVSGGALENAAGVGGPSTNRIYLADSKKKAVYYLGQYLGSAVEYENFANWSESFIWTPLSTKAIDTRYIFRASRPLSFSKWSGDNESGVFLYITANSYRVALRLRLVDGSVITLYIENFNHAVPSDANTGDLYTPGTRYAIEYMYIDGAYKVYVNGVYKRLYDDSSRGAGDRVDAGDGLGYVINKNVRVEYNSYTTSMVKGFGGDTQGGRGYIDEYAFKQITDTVAYDPTLYTWNGVTGVQTHSPITANIENDPNYSPSTPVIGVQAGLTVRGNQLVTTSSCFLKEYTDVGDKDVVFDYLPKNNRNYLFNRFRYNGLKAVKTTESTVIPFQYYNGVFKPKFWAFLWFNHNYDPDGNYYYDTANDLYGANWHPTVVDDEEAPTSGTLLENGFSAIPGGYFSTWGRFLTNSDFIVSNVDELNERWMHRLVCQRMDNSKYGVLFQTAYVDGTSASGLRVSYERLVDPGPLPDRDVIRIELSVDGLTWIDAGCLIDPLDPLIDDPTGLENFFYAAAHQGVISINVGWDGFRFGVSLSSTFTGSNITAMTWDWFQFLNFNFIDNVPVPMVMNGLSFLCIGGNAGTSIKDLRVHSFAVFPYSEPSNHKSLDEAYNYWTGTHNLHIDGNNFNDFLDRDLMWFDKKTMRTKFITDTDIGFTIPNFEDRDESVVFFGHADSDAGGVRFAVQYNENGRYETDWMIINSDDSVEIPHNLGTKDIRTTIYVNKRPVLDGSSIINNAGEIIDLAGAPGEETSGVWVDKVNDFNFTLNTHKYIFTGSDVEQREKTYMKIVVERTW